MYIISYKARILWLDVDQLTFSNAPALKRELPAYVDLSLEGYYKEVAYSSPLLISVSTYCRSTHCATTSYIGYSSTRLPSSDSIQLATICL